MKKMTALLAGAMLTMATGSAWATPTLQLSDGFTTVAIADGSALDLNPNAGAVTYLGSLGSWALNVSTGITKPFQGSALVPFMDLNSINSTSTTPGSLQILFSETDFISTPSVTGFTTAIGGTTQGTFQVKSFFDVGNTLFAETGALADLGPYAPVAFSGSETNSAATGSPGDLYSLTIDASINHTGAGSTSFDVQMTPVPEPGTMMLLGAGFLGLAIYGKRRKNA